MIKISDRAMSTLRLAAGDIDGRIIVRARSNEYLEELLSEGFIRFVCSMTAPVGAPYWISSIWEITSLGRNFATGTPIDYADRSSTPV